jgi:hypothetical protein
MISSTFKLIQHSYLMNSYIYIYIYICADFDLLLQSSLQVKPYCELKTESDKLPYHLVVCLFCFLLTALSTYYASDKLPYDSQG